MVEWMLFDVIHGVNRLLGSDGGELLKRSVESLLLLIVTYMTVSEWARSRRTHLRLLTFAFGALTLERLMIVAVYSYAVFANFSLYFVEQYFPVLDQFLEQLGILLLVYAFLYPAFVGREKVFRKHIQWWVMGTTVLAVLIEVAWVWLLRYQGATDFRTSFFGLVFELVQLSLCWYAVGMYILMPKVFGKYHLSVAFAFFLYSVSSIFQIIDIVIYDGRNDLMFIIAHPFPIIAILFFIRVIYLKLADKAFLELALREERKKVEHEKELSQMKDDFVSMVSHELRTPLTSMKLYLALLLERSLGPLTKDQDETLHIVEKENNRLAALVTSILDLAKLEQKKIVITPIDVDIAGILFESEYENLAREKHISLIHKVPRPFLVRVDPERFRQIFINLFSNAIKFTKEGGSIELSARKTSVGFEFAVADQGPGISADDVPKLFTKFFQSDQGMTRKVGGTGLGLVIVKQLVELHKGTVEVQSKVGRGSVFTIRIPQGAQSLESAVAGIHSESRGKELSVRGRKYEQPLSQNNRSASGKVQSLSAFRA